MPNFGTELTERKFNDSKLHRIAVTIDDGLFYYDHKLLNSWFGPMETIDILMGIKRDWNMVKVKGWIVQKHSIIELDRASNYMKTMHLKLMEKAEVIIMIQLIWLCRKLIKSLGTIFLLMPIFSSLQKIGNSSFFMKTRSCLLATIRPITRPAFKEKVIQIHRNFCYLKSYFLLLGAIISRGSP